MAMSQVVTYNHRLIEHFQHAGVQRGCGVTLVVASNALDVVKSDGQHQLDSLTGAALNPLVHAEVQSVVRRALVQPNDTLPLLDEKHVARELEPFNATAPKTKELEVARNTALGDAGFRDDRAHAPLPPSRLGMPRDLDQPRYALAIYDPLVARGPIVVQASDAPLEKAQSSFAGCGNA